MRATELETVPAAPTCGAGAGDNSWAEETAAEKRATARTTAKALIDEAIAANVCGERERERE